MKCITLTLSLFTAALSAALPVNAEPGPHGMDHNAMEQGTNAATGANRAGRPGEPANTARALNVTALDTMRFEPAMLNVKAGETIRFVVTNTGRVQHDFTIGDRAMQLEHEQTMKMQDMKHDEPNVVSIPPGETRTLLWQFDQAGIFEIGCHEPGHYPAGMRAVVEVMEGSAQAGRQAMRNGPTEPGAR